MPMGNAKRAAWHGQVEGRNWSHCQETREATQPLALYITPTRPWRSHPDRGFSRISSVVRILAQKILFSITSKLSSLPSFLDIAFILQSSLSHSVSSNPNLLPYQSSSLVSLFHGIHILMESLGRLPLRGRHPQRPFAHAIGAGNQSGRPGPT